MDSTVGPVLGCRILVVVLRLLWLVFYFFFSPRFPFFSILDFDWWLRLIDLKGSNYCVIRESEDGSSCLYRGCFDDLWWAAWVVVAVWAEGAFIHLIWMGCTPWGEMRDVSKDGDWDRSRCVFDSFFLSSSDWKCRNMSIRTSLNLSWWGYFMMTLLNLHRSSTTAIRASEWARQTFTQTQPNPNHKTGVTWNDHGFLSMIYRPSLFR